MILIRTLKNNLLALFTFSLFSPAFGQITDFWEKITPNITYENQEVGHTFPTVHNSFAINDNGKMIITYSAIKNHVQAYYSTDGINWKSYNLDQRTDLPSGFRPLAEIYSYRDKFLVLGEDDYGNQVYSISEDGLKIKGFNKWEDLWNTPDFMDNRANRFLSFQSGTSNEMIQNKNGYILSFLGNDKVSYERGNGVLYWDYNKNEFKFTSATKTIPNNSNVAWIQNIKSNSFNSTFVYKACGGKYYYSTLKGVLESDDGFVYQPLLTGQSPKIDGLIHGVKQFESEGTSYPSVICNFVFVSGKDPNLPDKSPIIFSEDGKNWVNTGLGDIRANGRTIRYNKKTKRFYLYIFGDGLYQSKKQYTCDCEISGEPELEEPELTYGTTIITHDHLFHPPIVHTSETWMQRMAEAILIKAKKGNIYTYKPESGFYEKYKSLGKNPEKGEQILIFDWSAESIMKEEGYTGSAGEALYLSLSKMNRGKDKIPLENIHFIGHGRGCIVNSLAIEKLYQDKTCAFSIDQVTNLGPYEREFDVNEKNEHPEMAEQLYTLPTLPPPNENGEPPILDRPYAGIIKWDNPDTEYDFSDTYWQANGKKYVYSIAKFATFGVLEISVGALREIDELKGIVGESILNQLKGLLGEYEQGLDPDKEESKLREIATSIKNVLSHFSSEDLKVFKKILSKGIKVIDLMGTFEEIVNSSFDSNPIRGSYNINWGKHNGKEVYHESSVDPIKDYIGICDVYIESIKSAEYEKCTFSYGGNQGGYCFSRLNGGKGFRTYFKGFEVKEFSYFDNLVYKDINRVRGIFNGSFDRMHVNIYGSLLNLNICTGGAGWELIDQPVIHILDDAFTHYPEEIALGMRHHGHYTSKPISLKHDRFYVPKQANSLSFLYACSSLNKGKLKIIVEAVNGDIVEETISFVEAVPPYKEFLIDIRSLKEKVVTLKFDFYETERKKDESSPSIFIKEVKLKQAVHLSTKANNSTTRKKENKKVQKIEKFSKVAVSNFTNTTFESLSGWQHSGGEVQIENETVSLKPQKKKTPVTLNHPKFIVPDNIRFLKFSMHKGRLKKADLKVMIKAIEDGAVTTIYEEEIRISALGNISNELNKVSQTLETSEFDAYKKKFEEVKIDVSAFKGKVVELEFFYLPIGSGKPKLFIDDVQFSN